MHKKLFYDLFFKIFIIKSRLFVKITKLQLFSLTHKVYLQFEILTFELVNNYV